MITPKTYILMPEGCAWTEIEAASAEMAYRAESCWYATNRKIAVLDKATGKTEIFTRRLDKNGNLAEVIRETA